MKQDLLVIRRYSDKFCGKELIQAVQARLVVCGAGSEAS